MGCFVNQPRSLAETMCCSHHYLPLFPNCSLTRSCLARSFSNLCVSHCSATYSMNFCPFTTNAFECSCSNISIRAFNSSSSWDHKQGHVNYFKSSVWSPNAVILPKSKQSLPLQSISSLTSGSWTHVGTGQSGQKSKPRMGHSQHP